MDSGLRRNDGEVIRKIATRLRWAALLTTA